MKTTKSLFLAFASLGLFACSNEDVVENGGAINGEANVTVQINTAAMSRALVDPTSSVAVTGTAIVTLETLDGPIPKSITLDGSAQKVSFEGVNGPGEISVNVNNYSSSGLALTDMNGNDAKNKELQAPMYAATNVSGWNFDPSTRTYTGTLSPKHEQVARLEFSGIKHVKDGDNACWFQSITFDGVFLNKIKGSTSGSAISASNWSEVTETNATTMPCFDVVNQSFMGDDGSVSFPADKKCYAYNIVAGDAPVLTLCFSNIKLTDEKTGSGSFWPSSGYGYAAVGTYKAKGSQIKDNKDGFGVTEETIVDDNMYQITKFPAGYIYRVTDLSLTDKNIGQTIDGKPVNVEATVDIAAWKLVDGEIDWSQGEQGEEE